MFSKASLWSRIDGKQGQAGCLKLVCLCVGSIKYRHENNAQCFLRCEMFSSGGKSFLQWLRAFTGKKRSSHKSECVYVCMCAHTHAIVGSLPVFPSWRFGSESTIVEASSPRRKMHVGLGGTCLGYTGITISSLSIWGIRAAPLKVVTGKHLALTKPPKSQLNC